MKNILKKFGLSFLALVFVLSVGIFADAKTASASGVATPTANMTFVLTTPADNGTTNKLTVNQVTKYVNVGVVNGTTSVTITGTKLSTQMVELSAAPGETGARDDSRNVVVTGTDINPIYTVNTVTNGLTSPDGPGDNVSLTGGNKTFTLTVSEGLLGPIVYIVNILVAGPLPAPVNLRTAGDFAVFANTGISFTGTTPNSITGDIGVGPGVTSTAITGDFALVLDSSTEFSKSVLVTGKVYAYDYTGLTPDKIQTASSDLTTAYNAALSPATTVLDAGSCVAGTCDLAGTTLVPGVYKFDVAHVIISDSMHLSGGLNDVWIFQIPGTLDIWSAKSILLSGSAVPANIFWAVAGTTTLETTSVFEGNILAGPSTSTIAMQEGATLHGRALGQTDVTLIGNTIVAPVASSDATLIRIDLTPNVGTISPLIAPSLLNTVDVPNSVTSVTVTPTVNENHATIKVNTVTVASGDASASIPLSVGNNPITITTTAQDLTTSSYTITVKRAASHSSSGSVPSTTSHNTTTAPGCSGGNKYNTSTGLLCVNNNNDFTITNTGGATTGALNAAPEGCSGGNKYNTSTGLLCVNNNNDFTITNTGGVTTGALNNFGTVTLKNGSKGEAVKELQRFLNAKLNLGLVIDGKLGPKTIAVIKKWQKDNGLLDDGLVGPKTKALMNSK
jgi:hypothetical protein